MSELTSDEIGVAEQLERLGWDDWEITKRIIHNRMKDQIDVVRADVITVLKRLRPGYIIRSYGVSDR